jgi:hypothetical protein
MFDKKMVLGDILGDFFSRTHLVTLPTAADMKNFCGYGLSE